MAKATVENLDKGQLGLMWNFLKMGSSKPNIPALKEHLDALRQLMIQKTAGQEPYSKSHEIPIEDLGTIINCIVIETMQIYLSGGLDKLENSSDAAPVKHGEWLPHNCDDDDLFYSSCSVCGKEGYSTDNFCPNCGAKMDGGDENE